MKNKALLFGSLAAMVLSAVLLIVPAQAFTPHCTSCTAVGANGVAVTANCSVRPIDSCFCPLSGHIVFNNCLRIP